MRTTCLALLCFALCAPALAAEPGAYLAAEVGAAKYRNVEGFPDPAMLGLGAGYRFNRFIGAEFGVTVFSNSTVNLGGAGSATLRAQSVHPALVAYSPEFGKFGLFGKLGVARNHGYATNTFGVRVSNWHTSPYVALGLQYAFDPQYGFRAQYENFGNFEDFSRPMRASAVSLGVYLNLQ